jgi:hypothetical protein
MWDGKQIIKLQVKKETKLKLYKVRRLLLRVIIIIIIIIIIFIDFKQSIQAKASHHRYRSSH